MRISSRMLAVLALLAAPVSAQDAPPLFEAMRAVPAATGQWSYVPTATGSYATFSNRFEISCDRAARRVTLRRIEPIATVPAPAAMTITTDLGTRTLGVGGVLFGTDRVLDAIAFSRGRFIVTGGGRSSQAVIPASPEAARSIEDCRF